MMNRDLQLLIAFLKPIEALLMDDSVTEIMGNPDGCWWYEREGIVHRAEGVSFDGKSLHTGLEVIANKLGKKLDKENPLLNAQLPDGSRLAAVLPPVVKPNPSVTVRKFSTVRYTVQDLVQKGALEPAIAAVSSAADRSRKNTAHQRRDRFGENDAPECAHRLHSAVGTHRGDRGHPRTADCQTQHPRRRMPDRFSCRNRGLR